MNNGKKRKYFIKNVQFFLFVVNIIVVFVFLINIFVCTTKGKNKFVRNKVIIFIKLKKIAI